MATITNISDSVSMKINAGTDAHGNQKTASVAFPKITNVDDLYDKILAVTEKYEAVAEDYIYSVETRTVDWISA